MKKLALTVSLIAISTTALAKDMKVDLYGKLDTQFGYRQQKGPFKYDSASYGNGKLDNYGIVNDSKLGFSAAGKLNNGVEYGAIIEINSDTSKDSTREESRIGKKTMFYMQNARLGKLEAGAGNAGASGTMQVSANKIARGAGGIKGAATKWINKKYPVPTLGTADFDKEFIKWPTLPTDCNYDDNASKLSYYTPVFSGFQLGVSYTPNLDHTGTVSDINSPAAPTSDMAAAAVEKFKNVGQVGISYATKINDFDIKTSFTAENAKSFGTTPARHGIEAWEVGAVVGYKGFSVAGSYSDWKKTGAPRDAVSGKKYGGGYWTAGASYTKDQFGVSATYFQSKTANLFTSDENISAYSAKGALVSKSNKFEILSIGADYTVVKGLMPYAEVSFFKAKHATAVVNNKGTIYLVGTKLTF
jgi:outer membrane protein OmpU